MHGSTSWAINLSSVSDETEMCASGERGGICSSAHVKAINHSSEALTPHTSEIDQKYRAYKSVYEGCAYEGTALFI